MGTCNGGTQTLFPNWVKSTLFTRKKKEYEKWVEGVEFCLICQRYNSCYIK